MAFRALSAPQLSGPKPGLTRAFTVMPVLPIK
jgi:hypothetical protein